MSSEEKRVSVSLISSLIVLGLYIYYGAGLHASGQLEGPEAGNLVGKSAFIMIGIGIVVSIVIHILFTILHAMATGAQAGEQTENGADERDKLIELKAMQIAFVAFSIGFMALLGIMTFGSIGPYLVILLTIACLYGASILADCIKLYLYRRGF